jgi:FlaA1/EpsC-like NDP-sugar epimerase
VLDNKAISKQLKDKTIDYRRCRFYRSEIVRQVLSFKLKKIIILDQAETPLHHLRLETEVSFQALKYYQVADIRNKEALNKVYNLYKPQVVFHAAAYKHVPLMEENLRKRFSPMLKEQKTWQIWCEYNVVKFVMVSTDKAVNPSNVMGASKRIAEKYVHLQLKSRKRIT